MKQLLVMPLFGFLGAAALQAPRPIESIAEPYRIQVNVHLVLVHATVHDAKGRLVSDLVEQDFTLYEDGVRQSVRLFRHEDLPVTVGLVVDHSGSMRAKLADVVAAARTFVQSSNPEDQMFVVNFNEKVTLGLPAGIQFTNRPDELTRAIANTPTTGQTALYDAVIAAGKLLQSGKWDKKVLLVISDGADNASRHSLAQALDVVERSSVLIYSVGIFDAEDPDKNPKVLRRLAAATGGEAFFPDRYNAVIGDCEHIAREIRHQYTLGYVSTNVALTKELRAIKVVAKASGKGKLMVRARTGYVAGDESEPVK